MRTADRGSATVWAAGAVFALVALAALGIHLGAAAVARHRAEAAADLSALAAAVQASSGADSACQRAAQVATRNGATLRSCALQDWDALVEVTVRPPGPIAALGQATGRARAGPAGS